MSGADFLDSNVLIYAYDTTYPDKQRVAKQLVGRALMGESIVSTQVFAEFASTFLHKSAVRMTPGSVTAILDGLRSIRVVTVGREEVARAVDAHKRYGLHFYDGMIVAAAERAGCGRIWSEDLNPGQTYFGIRVENPFR